MEYKVYLEMKSLIFEDYMGKGVINERDELLEALDVKFMTESEDADYAKRIDDVFKKLPESNDTDNMNRKLRAKLKEARKLSKDLKASPDKANAVRVIRICHNLLALIGVALACIGLMVC